jgi:polysaccharide transporter, PST family
LIENLPESGAGALRAKAVRGASVNIIAQFVGIAVQTIGVVILARLLKPQDFGVVAMVTAFSLWLANFGVNGFTEYIIQKQEMRKEEISSVFWLHLFIAASLAVGFVFFGLFLVGFYGEPALSGIAVAMSVTFIMQALSTTHIALLKREMKFARVAIAELASVALSILLAIAAALLGLGYWAVVTRQITVPFVMFLAAWLLCRWRPTVPRRLTEAWPALKYAIQVYLNFTLGFLMRGVDKVLLGKYHGSELLGNYDRAYHIFSMPAAQIITPLHSVALATLSRLKHDKDRFSAFYAKAIVLVAFPGTLVALALTVSAKDLVFLLLGPSWVEAGRVVMAFGPGVAADLVYGTHSWLHLSLGTPGRWLRWNIFASVFTMIAFFVAAPHGAVAMAIAYSVRGFLLIIPSIWYAGRPIRLGLRSIVTYMRAYFVSAAAVLLGWLWLTNHWLPLKDFITGLNPFLRIITASFITSLGYVALVVVLQRSFRSVRDIISLIPQILSRQKE